MKRRIMAILLAMVLSASVFVNTFANSDSRIFTDPVENTYIGRLEATDIIDNANFRDVPANHWAKEAITRMAALNIVKGYTNYYSPSATVSNQEAIAFLLRAIGLEQASQASGIALQATFPDNSSARNLWSLGYLQQARTRNIITQQQYDDALTEDPTTLEAEDAFYRDAPVTRAQVADWLVKTLESVDANAFDFGTTQQSVYQYSDWETIEPNKVAAVEKVSMAGIMSGSNGRFRPNSSITRAEMAQVLKNMDVILYRLNGITKKTGTIGAVVNENVMATGNTVIGKAIYIRTLNGTIDVINYVTTPNSSPQPQTLDVPTYASGKVSGLSVLREDEQIEYLVRTLDNTVLYVQKTSEVKEVSVEGKLVSVNQTDNLITIRDDAGNMTTYKLVQGLIRNNINNQPSLYMDENDRLISSLPIGSTLELTVKNNIVTILNYLGEPEVYKEIRGVVTENNPGLGYITVVNNAGKEVTKKYYANTIKVEKQQYYDAMDEIGYIDSIFPNFEYDPRDTYVEDVEAGDIVFLTLDPTNTDYVASVSASTNYNIKYGKVKQVQQADADYVTILMEYENRQTQVVEVPTSIFVSKDSAPATLSDIMAGDWIKVLVNEAIVTPGYVIQSAKEITIEGAERYVSNIYKAQLSAINAAQQQLVLKNVQLLDKTGWGAYQQVKNISLNNSSGIEFYYNGGRISLDFAMARLKNNYEAYVATENSFGGEKAVKVSIRASRDQLLSSDNIIYADGNGTIGTSNKSSIATDMGTIVVRHGRLTDSMSVMVPDYATIALNGNNTAAVVSIEDTPNVAGLIIARGRIASIDEGKSFKVQSEAILNDMKWSYTPVQREFTIDYDTQFIGESGMVDADTFIDYTDETKVDKVYTIITDGSRAIQVIDDKYATKGVRGTIASIDGNTVKIKDAYMYNNKTGVWSAVSAKNSALNITIPTNYIIVKNNQSAGLNALEVGSQIRVMTDTLADKPTEATAINAVITFIEK